MLIDLKDKLDKLNIPPKGPGEVLDWDVEPNKQSVHSWGIESCGLMLGLKMKDMLWAGTEAHAYDIQMLPNKEMRWKSES